MARRVIGLDVGTSAVTVAEVTPGAPARLSAFGQVALPADAVRDGEVVDDAALIDAVKRLRAEVGLRRGAVRLGVSSPRVIVRAVEMPVMPRADLESALRFQIPDLIPIPVDDAVVDFAVLDEATDPATGAPVQRVLLAAAPRTLVERHVAAVAAAGFDVESVDLGPLAALRSAATVDDASAGAEAIIVFGGGVTSVVVHEGGVPRFVRVIGSGGRALTAAIAASLDVPTDTAESLKRQIGSVDDSAVEQARAACERTLTALLDEVRSSVDFYRNQPGALPLRGVRITGGGAQLAPVRARLATMLGVPVEPATPRADIAVGDIGFSVDELPRLDPFLTVALGLALGREHGVGVDLAPGAARGEHDRRRGRAVVMAGVGLLALLALLAVPVVARHRSASSLDREAAAVEQHNQATRVAIAGLSGQASNRSQYLALNAQVAAALSSDVSWSRMLNEIARSMPDDVWLTAFRGSVSGAGPQGNVTIAANGLDYNAVADWIARISTLSSLTNLWVPQAATTQYGTRTIVGFSSTAQLTAKARSDRTADSVAGGTR